MLNLQISNEYDAKQQDVLGDEKKMLMVRNRERSVNELITTEHKYVKRLERLQSIYIDPLRNEKNTILFHEHHETLFPKVLSSIIPLNKALLASLQAEKSMIGHAMLQFIPFFKMYQQYLNNYDSINKLMQEHRKNKNSPFCLYLRTQEKKEGYTLESYLIEPIQRIPRYQLLIKEIVKNTDKQHDDYHNLETCFTKISQVNQKINARITEYEQRHKVFLIEMSIINLDINQRYSSTTNIFASWFNNSKSKQNKFRLVSPSRRFIKRGYLTKVSRKGHIRYIFILFNDLLMYCSDAMNRMMIMHERINLNDPYFELKKVEQNKELCDYNAFEIHSIEKSFIAYAATYKETGDWFDEIQKCVDHIRDHQNLRVAEHDAVINKTEDTSNNVRIIKTSPLWSPKQKNTECMMADCSKQLTSWFTYSYYCNYCGKLVCSDCYRHKLLHYDPVKRKENMKVWVCNECYREHRNLVRRVSVSESDMKFDLDDLQLSEQESEEDIAKGFLCFQQLLQMGFDQNVAEQASKQYKNVKHAVKYIQQNGLDAEKKVNMEDMDELMSSKYRTVDFDIFVAIDFGTHGTGLGYAVKQKKMEQWGGSTEDEYEYVTFLETDWCSTSSGEIKNKTDILLTYDGKFKAFGYEALHQYVSVEDEMSDDSDDDDDNKMDLEQRDMLFESFKMSLYENKGEHEGDIKEEIPCKDGRLLSTEIVFVEALKFIKQSIFKTFKKNGLNITDCDCDLQRIQWICTVPAIWSDRAKYKMEIWATKAGLIQADIENHLRIVYEPDCASISCQYERNEKSQLMTESKPFEKGEKYILIDAGGGTVDIACHQVMEEDQMQEIYHPSGGAWGSDYVDEHFISFLGELFGEDIVTEYIHRFPHDFTKIIDNFRHSKMRFYQQKACTQHSTQLTSSFILEQDVDDIEEYINNKAPFGLKNSVHLKNETLSLSVDIWRKHLFDKILDPMIQHIEDLLCNKVNDINYLCICGGLSMAKYFQNRMEETFGMHSKYKLSIRIPRRPILSVIDGAVRLATRCNNNYIIGRKLRMTYGIAADRSLDQLDLDKLPANYLDTHMVSGSSSANATVSGLFSIFVSKNDLIKMGQFIEKEYKRFDMNERKKVIKIYCDNKKDPYIVSGQPLAEFPIYFKPNYTALKFKVKFYFGNTQIRVFAMNDELQLKYKFYNTSKYIELQKPNKPTIEDVDIYEKELKMEIRVNCSGYDDIEYRAWFEVQFIDIDDENIDFELKDKKYETSPIILTDLRIGVVYKIAVKCVNDKYDTCSDVYKDTFIFRQTPSIPTIRSKYAKDSMVALEYECLEYEFNKKDEECRPKYEIKIATNRKSIHTKDTSIEIDSLENGVDYKFRIRAVNKYGASNWTQAVLLTPLKQPYKPSDLCLVAGSSSIAVYWLSFDNMEEYYLCGEFEIISEPDTKRKIVRNKHKAEFKLDDGLKYEVLYKFKVIARNDSYVIESDWTNCIELDKNKEKTVYKQEKKMMMQKVYKLHKTRYNKNNQNNENMSDIQKSNEKRNENIERVSNKMQTKKKSRVTLPAASMNDNKEVNRINENGPESHRNNNDDPV